MFHSPLDHHHLILLFDDDRKCNVSERFHPEPQAVSKKKTPTLPVDLPSSPSQLIIKLNAKWPVFYFLVWAILHSFLMMSVGETRINHSPQAPLISYYFLCGGKRSVTKCGGRIFLFILLIVSDGLARGRTG